MKVDEASRLYRAESATRDTFAEVEDLFKTIATAYLQKGSRPRRIVVFVDDLDRCKPQRMLEVLEAVKLFFDLSGMVFVFALDRGQLETAIETTYRFAPGQGRVYLEKIFQLTVTLPAKGTSSLIAFLEEQLEAVDVGRVDADLARAIVERFGRNLRDVKLFANALSFQRSLGASAADDEALIKWQYLETTIFRALPTTYADEQIGLMRALELLAHGAFLHDLPEQERFMRALRGGAVNHCALIVLALVRARRAEMLPEVPLKPAEQALLSALEADGDVSAALRVMRAGRLRMADVSGIPAMASLTYEAMPPCRTSAGGGEPEEGEKVTLEAGGLLSASAWTRVGTGLNDGGDRAGAYLCHLMALLMEPGSASHLANIARALRHDGRTDGAKAVLRHAHELGSDSAAVHTQTGYLYHRALGRKDVGDLLYSKVLELGTPSSTVPSYLGMLRFERGDFDVAYLCTLEAYLLRAGTSGRGRRLLRYAEKADNPIPVGSPDQLEKVRDALERLLSEARRTARYPPPRNAGDDERIEQLYASFPTLSAAADDLSDPLLAQLRSTVGPLSLEPPDGPAAR